MEADAVDQSLVDAAKEVSERLADLHIVLLVELHKAG
jgi:hypothetical protein